MMMEFLYGRPYWELIFALPWLFLMWHRERQRIRDLVAENEHGAYCPHGIRRPKNCRACIEALFNEPAAILKVGILDAVEKSPLAHLPELPEIPVGRKLETVVKMDNLLFGPKVIVPAETAQTSGFYESSLPFGNAVTKYVAVFSKGILPHCTRMRCYVAGNLINDQPGPFGDETTRRLEFESQWRHQGPVRFEFDFDSGCPGGTIAMGYVFR